MEARSAQKKSKAARPADRPLRLMAKRDIQKCFETALASSDGVEAAHCVHELWMRRRSRGTVEGMLAQLSEHSDVHVPEWLPGRYVQWLPVAYEVAGRFKAAARGRTNVYLVLLDYSDRRAEPYGIYVGMSKYPAAVRLEQHRSGVRSAGSVRNRGLEVLSGPVMHLQNILRAEAARIEAELADALKSEGLLVKGGH